MSAAEHLELVEAKPEDCEVVWRINNEPGARAQSLQPASILWEEHVAWYDRILADDNQRLWLAREGGDVVGVVRFRLDGEEATISIALDVACRGRGLGMHVIQAAGARLLAERSTLVLWAHVRATNVASVKAFLRAGYEEVDEQALPDGGLLKRFRR